MKFIDDVKGRMRRSRLEFQLDNARWHYWLTDIDRAISILQELDDDVIQEPPFDSEEYRNGERKPSQPDDEQEQEKETEQDGDWRAGVVVEDVYAERDDDGYLIR